VKGVDPSVSRYYLRLAYRSPNPSQVFLPVVEGVSENQGEIGSLRVAQAGIDLQSQEVVVSQLYS